MFWILGLFIFGGMFYYSLENFVKRKEERTSDILLLVLSGLVLVLVYGWIILTFGIILTLVYIIYLGITKLKSIKNEYKTTST